MKPGLHYNLGMAEYHAWRLDKANLMAGPISCSTLKAFAVNPYAWLRAEDKGRTPAMLLGCVMDAALTEPQTLDDTLQECYGVDPSLTIAPFDDFRTKEARAWKADAEANGIAYVSQNEHAKMCDAADALIEKMRENAMECAQAVRSHAVAGQIMDGARTQVGAIDEFGGIPTKALIDIVPDPDGLWADVLWDYKTTSNGLDDNNLAKTIGTYGWHKQGAFYLTCANKAALEPRWSRFGLIVQDPSTREVRVTILTPDALSIGRMWVRQAMKDFVTAAHKGIRSRYADRADAIDLMPYHAMDDESWVTQRELEEKHNV